MPESVGAPVRNLASAPGAGKRTYRQIEIPDRLCNHGGEFSIKGDLYFVCYMDMACRQAALDG